MTLVITGLFWIIPAAISKSFAWAILGMILFFFVQFGWWLDGRTLQYKLRCPNCKMTTERGSGVFFSNTHSGYKILMKCPNCSKLGWLEHYDAAKVSKVEKIDPRELYNQLLLFYRDLYGNENRLEREIEYHIRKGLNREDAILEIGIKNSHIF